MDKYAYLLINIFTVLGPLTLSPLAPANQKAFLKKIFPSILIIAAYFYYPRYCVYRPGRLGI